MLIILLGAPGAGKATICSKLKEFYQFDTLVTGELLRKEVRENTELGQKVKAIMNKGHLVQDQILIDLVTEQLHTDGHLILDGFPRTLFQADALHQYLEHHGKRIDLVLHFAVDDQHAFDRVSGRRICPDCGKLYHNSFFPPKKEGICDVCGAPLYQRADDQPENLKVKLQEYHEKTQPLVEYYKDLGLLKQIDANQSVMDVYYQLLESNTKFTEMSY